MVYSVGISVVGLQPARRQRRRQQPRRVRRQHRQPPTLTTLTTAAAAAAGPDGPDGGPELPQQLRSLRQPRRCGPAHLDDLELRRLPSNPRRLPSQHPHLNSEFRTKSASLAPQAMTLWCAGCFRSAHPARVVFDEDRPAALLAAQLRLFCAIDMVVPLRLCRGAGVECGPGGGVAADAPHQQLAARAAAETISHQTHHRHGISQT